MELKKNQWRYHLILGCIILIMHVFGSYVRRGGEVFMQRLGVEYFMYLVVFFIPFFAIYFMNFLVLCPRTIARKRKALFVVGLIILVFVYAGIRYVLDEVIMLQITGHHNYTDSGRRLVYYVFDNSYYALTAILYSTVLFLFFEYIQNKGRIYELELEHKKAELSLLKTQLEPHFLFNTLNSFYTELVDTKPETAKDIHKLSELLRYVTYESHHDVMPLNKEVKFIEDYIYFNRKRFEDNLFLEYKIEGVVGAQPIPSLVLIHFIENIFKHGTVNDKLNPAKFDIVVTDYSIEVKTKNKVSTSEKYTNKGIGEENLRRRLTAIYKNDFDLKYDESEGFFEAYLKMPLQN